jgi:hypothetical protein
MRLRKEKLWLADVSAASRRQDIQVGFNACKVFISKIAINVRNKFWPVTGSLTSVNFALTLILALMKQLFLLAFLGVAAPGPGSVSASVLMQQTAPNEKQKIELLIRYIEGLKGAEFIRNGTGHSPTEAAAHLRLKYSKAGNKVKTATDFINICASRSSTSGKDYTIKTADGRERTSREVLLEQLKIIEARRQP